jgi:hypothetical protein
MPTAYLTLATGSFSFCRQYDGQRDQVKGAANQERREQTRIDSQEKHAARTQHARRGIQRPAQPIEGGSTILPRC